MRVPGVLLVVLRLMVWGFLVGAGCGPQGPDGGSDGPRPARLIVLVPIDTLRADHLSGYGYERETSPNLDALGAEGIVFENALANSNNTGPSHMTLFTGVLPPVHGVRHESGTALSPSIPTLPELLQAAGYRTVGFADGGYVVDAFGFARGFDVFESQLEPFERKLDRVAEWLVGAEDEPTFLFVHTYGVHAPYVTDPRNQVYSDPDYDGPFRARMEQIRERMGLLMSAQEQLTDARRMELLGLLMEEFWADRSEFTGADRQHLVDLYDACILGTDAGLGRLLGLLETVGWLDQAWIIVTSDHGEAFREHGTYSHRQLYDEELHVPLIVRPPGGASPPERRPEVVSLVDLAPTLLALAGVPAPAAMQGQALLGATRPGDRPVHATSGESPDFHAFVANGHKLVVRKDGELELYARGDDPAEANDLSGTPAEAATLEALHALATRMLAASAALRAAVGDPHAAGVLTEEEESALRALGYVK